MFAFLLPAVLLVYGIGRGAASIAGEEEEHTLDLLLAQPYRAVVGLPAEGGRGRRRASCSWASPDGCPVAALNRRCKFDLPAVNLAAVTVQMTLMCLALSLVAQAIAAWTGRRSLGIAIVAGYAFVSYVVYGLAGTVTWLEHVRPLTLWRWYLLNDPLANGFGWSSAWCSPATCVTSRPSRGALLFARRDLHG